MIVEKLRKAMEKIDKSRVKKAVFRLFKGIPYTPRGKQSIARKANSNLAPLQQVREEGRKSV